MSPFQEGVEIQGECNSAPSVRFSDISFRYRDEGPDVLKDISFSVPAGGTLAIVGQTGSGKSSLARLLTRLYEPQRGTVFIGGRKWDEIPLNELRRIVAYVDQTPFLFSATIEENIRFGDPDSSAEDIDAVVYASCFDRDMEQFAEGYKTLIGERGVTLSGGQQQRLTLARALATDAPVLVLDDALSAVDADTETEIISRLRRRVQGRTLLIITHRLAAAETADAVAVLDKGRLVEFGPPDELIASGGLYSKMHRRQRLAREIEEL